MNKVIYKCALCFNEFEVEQGSRRRFCPECQHRREVEGGKEGVRRKSIVRLLRSRGIEKGE